MTNQEPGAPEPLTGLREGEEWRHRPAAILHWSPVAPGDPTECVVCPETWPCQAERVRAALSHPESDTRGLTGREAIERAIRLWWNDTMRKDWRESLDESHSRAAVLDELADVIERSLSASPDLSIDRECAICGATVPAAAWTRHLENGCQPEAAIRETTQPEPTE